MSTCGHAHSQEARWYEWSERLRNQTNIIEEKDRGTALLFPIGLLYTAT